MNSMPCTVESWKRLPRKELVLVPVSVPKWKTLTLVPRKRKKKRSHRKVTNDLRRINLTASAPVAIKIEVTRSEKESLVATRKVKTSVARRERGKEKIVIVARTSPTVVAQIPKETRRMKKGAESVDAKEGRLVLTAATRWRMIQSMTNKTINR